MFSRRHLATGVLAGLAAGATGWAVWRRAGGTLPEVEYTLLDGSRHHTRELAGRVVLVTFWATTCSVCVKEMPQLVALHRALEPRGLATLAVAMHYDPPAAVDDFARSRALPFGVAIDNTRAIERAFGEVAGTPTSLVIDRRARIVERITGAPDFAALQARLERLLAAPAA